MKRAVLSLQHCRHGAASWLRWLFLPLLFQSFLVVGALDPLLASGSAVHSTSPLCSVFAQPATTVDQSRAPRLPSPHDIGFDHGHCPLCASLAYSLPVDDPVAVKPDLRSHSSSLPSLRQSMPRCSAKFVHPPAHAPPTFS